MVPEEPRVLEAEAAGGVIGRYIEERGSPARERDVSSDRRNVPWSPENILIDIVAQLQQDLWRISGLNLGNYGCRGIHLLCRPIGRLRLRQPKYHSLEERPGTTSWEQYRQVFDAMVLSNGWDDATAALQLLSHLEGDALNVALLVPVSRRTSITDLVDALSAHYGSPGRLADNRRQFEKTTRSAGEDPSIFAIALETLAIKAFGDMGPTALIRDRFIAGHSSCELCRYLDSVPPETPIRDVVDRCRVWERHADPEIRSQVRSEVSKPGLEPIYPAYVVDDLDRVVEEIRVVAVTKLTSPPDQVEDLFQRLLAGVAPPAPVPEVPVVEKLLQHLVAETQIRQPAPLVASEPAGLETLLRSLLSGQRAPVQQPRQGSFRRYWNAVVCFSCGKAGHSATRCPTLDETFLLPGWTAEKTRGGYIMISPRVAVEHRRAENGD